MQLGNASTIPLFCCGCKNTGNARPPLSTPPPPSQPCGVLLTLFLRCPSATFCAHRFASKLSVQVYESQGVLQAFYNLQEHSSSNSSQRQAPAAAVYVKVFAKDESGDVWFYK